ncbi:MAG: hypothetical protein V2J07_00165 [Anaerolineae bacterium]|jgi:hypothetical protein|nr:hypothetical protein [Anaerolineae bacterium]
MRTFFYRAAGVLLVISAIAGLLLGGFGIWGIWEIKPQAEVFLTDTTQTAVDAIDLADGALEEVTKTLEVLNEGLQSINGVKDNLAGMLTGITPVLESTSSFVGDDLVAVLSGVQNAFNTLNAGMTAVQNSLSFLRFVPLLGDYVYDSSTSMTDGVDEMEGQVSGLTTSFEALEEDLLTASANMEELQTNIEGFADAVDEADLTLQRHLDNVASYQEELRGIRQDVLDFRVRWLRNIQRIAVWSTVILAWMLLLMLGVTVLGGDLVVHGDQRQIAREKAYLNEALEPLLLDKVTPQLRDQLRAEILEELRGELGLLPDGYDRLQLEEEDEMEPHQLRDYIEGEYDETWDGGIKARDQSEEPSRPGDADDDQDDADFVEGTYTEDDTEPIG